MSNLNPLDPSRAVPDNRSKVIVIKNMNMPSFKFDPSKNFLSTTNISSEPVFTVKPQLVQQTPINHQRVIVQPAVPNITTQQGKIIIRAAIGNKTPQSQQQFTTLTPCSKVQESQPAPAPVQNFTTFRSKSTEMAMKNPTGQTLMIQPTALVKSPPGLQVPTGVKTFTFTTKIPASQKISISQSSPKLIPIRAKPQQPQIVSQSQPAPSFARIISGSPKWAVNYQPPVPALTLIQPKPIVKPLAIERIVESVEAEDQLKLSQVEKSPEKPKRSASAEERFQEVKRIIEGDLDEILDQFEQQEEGASASETYEMEIEEVEEAEDEEEEEAESSQSLLCDEKIDSISPETDKDQQETTPASSEVKKTDSQETRKSVDVVKKNLSLELSKEFDKENMCDDSESEQRSVLESEDTETGKTPSTPPSVSELKTKRTRKPKNPTIIATLGLPYKPSGVVNRKSKGEKKLEFELDFHDPINKIQWDDGVGGLENCNKLFGFDDFGLVEVLNKKDVKAKLKQLEVREEPNGDFKLRKINDPSDQFVCSVCNKLGTIRDFYTPECCSESCLAITKRKLNESLKESSSDSGMTTPVDERKLMFGGELIPLQQLQHHLLEKQLPPSQRRHVIKMPSAKIIDSKFQWDTYLPSNSMPAPVNLFKNPYPRCPNPFKVGMKLEAIDPENQKLFCVCTIEEKLGYRIKLHFDGFSAMYDFWINADSQNIFPVGFCSSTSRVLQTPPKCSAKKFDWSEYLDHANSVGAQKAMFQHLSKIYDENPFEVGMKLEAMNEGNLYAVTVIDVLQSRVLIEFDSHSEIQCRWMDIHSPYLHPCDFHKTIAKPECFIPPYRPFTWSEYIKDTCSKKAPAEFLFFRTRSPFDFESGHKLEVVDRVNRQLIRPASVLCRNDYKIQILFDGFDISFAYWLDDDSDDIHPINWCEKTVHPIEFPPGYNKSLDTGLCPTPGCRGIGNAVHIERFFHDNTQECPYIKDNWMKLSNPTLPSRIDLKNIRKAIAKTNGTQAITINLKHEVESLGGTSVDTHDETSSEAGRIPAKRGRKRKIVVETSDAQRIKISKPFLENYGPQLNYSFNLWKSNSSVLDRASVEGKFSQNPMKWSTSTVAEYIIKITGDIDLAMKFEEQEIDGEDFVSMCQNDLTSLMNIKLGPAVKIYNRILLLREEVMLKFMKI